MAQASREMDAREQSKTSGTVVPMKPGPLPLATGQEGKPWISNRPSMREPVDEGKQWAGSNSPSAKRTVVEFYRTTGRRASEAYIDICSAYHSLSTRVRHRADQMKDEHPLQLLAVIAGATIVLGVSARIWRSRHHA